jgi:hypothetical protein
VRVMIVSFRGLRGVALNELSTLTPVFDSHMR